VCDGIKKDGDHSNPFDINVPELCYTLISTIRYHFSLERSANGMDQWVAYSFLSECEWDVVGARRCFLRAGLEPIALKERSHFKVGSAEKFQLQLPHKARLSPSYTRPIIMKASSLALGINPTPSQVISEVFT